MNNSIGALWKRLGKNGEYLSGNVVVDGKKIEIVVFLNDKGENEKRPDYRIYLSDKSISHDTKASYDVGGGEGIF